MKKFLLLLHMILIVGMLLTSCAPAVPAVVEPATSQKSEEPTQVPQPPATEAPAAPEPTVAAAEVEPAAVLEIDKDYAGHIVTIALKDGLKWSDGSAITTADVVGTYELYWATNQAVWGYLEKIQALDEKTTVFYLNDISPRVIRYLLRQMLLYPRAMYGDWMDQAAELRATDPKRESEGFKKFLVDFSSYKPDLPIVSGPFHFESPDKFGESQFELVKNPSGYNAEKISFDKITAIYGETNICTPLVQSGLIDWSASGYPPAAVQTFEDAGLTVLVKPLGIGPGIIFNHAKAPYNKKEFRQAVAYIIDRQQNGTVAMGKAGHAYKYVAGLPDWAVEKWIPDAIPQLNTYEKDWAKAEELLKGIGFTKGSDGMWSDDQGKKVDYLLSVAAQWTDYLGAAEDAADQLTKFGLKTSVDAFQDVEYDSTLISGKFDMFVGFVGSAFNPPFPYREFEVAFMPPYNNPEDSGNPGSSIPFEMTTPDGEKFDIRDAVRNMSAGMDEEAQKPWVKKAALALNADVLVLPLWERYSTNVVNPQRVEGWANFENDPIWLNVHYGDHPAVIQILDGKLNPVEGFWSACSGYVQPPKGHFNAFISDYVVTSMTPEVGQLLYLPFYYYIWASGEYKPILAEKYEIVK